jgi:ankyrin repeat protein
VRYFLIFAAACVLSLDAHGEELTVNQRLIVACHRVDVNGVLTALRDDADVNARCGRVDPDVFRDPWSLSWPLPASAWTPLLALANASQYPNPPRKVQNTSADLNWAEDQQKKIPREILDQRQRDSQAILMILLSNKANIDADDGYGATPLFCAVDEEKVEMARMLLRFGAKVNTKTGIYIDGPGDMTPLHEACDSVELTKLLLENGADPTAKDTNGKTPLDWAKLFGKEEVIRLYKESRKAIHSSLVPTSEGPKLASAMCRPSGAPECCLWSIGSPP